MASTPTLDDVAAAVGVSSRTVSRVLRNEGGYSSATEQRVREVVAQLDYSPNLLVRSIGTQRSGLIGIVGPTSSDRRFGEFSDQLQRHIRDLGCIALCASSLGDADQQRDTLRSLRSLGVDGVVIHPVAGTHRAVAQYARSGTPVVAIERDWHAPGLASVATDAHLGATLAVASLLRLGRRRIGLIEAQTTSGSPSSQRHGRHRTGFESALPEHHPLLAQIATSDIAGGRFAARRLLERVPDIDGIVTHDDVVAVGALDALAEAGRVVPDDVAVVGYGDVFAAQVSRPALSTIRCDHEAMAAVVVETLERLIAEPTHEAGVTRVPVELVERASTRGARR